jgi:O-methyltransferase|tara:strand:+ start:1403 stop:2410 length:1008 start_codon:yes stop_codon:yes gene_type:complete
MKTTEQEQRAINLYLTAIRDNILGYTYRDPEFQPADATQLPFNREARSKGQTWPFLAQTMAGEHRIDNVRALVEDVETKGIPGDFIETGVWRGGCSLMAAAVMQAYDIKDRKVIVCDSFDGLPPPNTGKYPTDEGDKHFEALFLKVSIHEVIENFKGYGLLNPDRIRFIMGLFGDTLPKLVEGGFNQDEWPLEVKQFSVIRLDGDMYESTIQALENLYPLLSVGGHLIIDDYGLPNCVKAINDYREFHGLDEELVGIDESSKYWTKVKEIDPELAKHRFGATPPPQQQQDLNVPGADGTNQNPYNLSNEQIAQGQAPTESGFSDPNKGSAISSDF